MADDSAFRADGTADVVFLDASVLFKAAVTRFLLGGARAGEFLVAWSDAVVEEARRNLTDAGRSGALAAFEQNLVWLRDVTVVAANRRVQASLKHTHEKDRHVLAAAVAAEAKLLVTGNVKDFDQAEAARRGVTVVTPDEFATSVAERNVDALVRYVERTPPERLERYLQLLGLELPGAVALITPLLRS